MPFYLLAATKKAKNQDKFYKDLVSESVAILEEHEQRLENERRNKNDGKQNVSKISKTSTDKG